MSDASALPEPIPAATLVLMRERADGPPELLVTERTGHMAFAAGALVFPGGRIDADDHRDRRDAGARPAPTRRRGSRRCAGSVGDPYGNRTRVSAVKGPRPRPLDEGAERPGASDGGT